MVDIMPENLPALSPVILFSQPSCTSNKISKNQWAYLVQRLSPCFEAPQKENLTRYFTMLLRSGGHCSLWCSLLPQQWPSRAFPHTNWSCSISWVCPLVHTTHTAILPKLMSAWSVGASNLRGTELKSVLPQYHRSLGLFTQVTQTLPIPSQWILIERELGLTSCPCNSVAHLRLSQMF